MFIFLFNLSFLTSQALANTLLEQSATLSIQNTLSNTASPSYDTEESKKAIENYNKSLEKRSAQYENSYDNPSHDLRHDYDKPSHEKRYERDEQDKLSSVIQQQIANHDYNKNKTLQDGSYNKKLQVLYTKICPPETYSNKECNRGPVLTNIKSVVFDYNNRKNMYANVPKVKKDKANKTKNTNLLSQSERALASSSPSPDEETFESEKNLKTPKEFLEDFEDEKSLKPSEPLKKAQPQ